MASSGSGCDTLPGDAAFAGSDGVLAFVSLVPPFACFAHYSIRDTQRYESIGHEGEIMHEINVPCWHDLVSPVERANPSQPAHFIREWNHNH
jgi:hypothetical protein